MNPVDLDLDRFAQVIVEPARAKWGPGWELLSDDQKLTEIRAQVLLNISGQDSVDGDAQAALALGLYVRRLLAELDAWCQP